MTSTRDLLDKRRHERYSVSIESEMSISAEAIDCFTLDISRGGARIRFKKDRFQQVILSISPFGEFTGKIVWMDDEYVGIAFDEDHEKISEIVMALGAQTGGS